MATITITRINLRPVQEFTGDRMKQTQRMNSDVRTGLALGIHQMRVLTHRTLLTSVGLGGLVYDSARRRAVDSWELLDKAEQRGEEIEERFVADVSERVRGLENQASNELQRLRSQLPEVRSIPTMSTVPGSQLVSDQLDRPLDWTVRRFTIRRQNNGVDHLLLADYEKLTAQQIIEMAPHMDVARLEAMRAYELDGKTRVTVLRALDTQLEERLAVS